MTDQPVGSTSWPYFMQPTSQSGRDLVESHLVYIDFPKERPLPLGDARFTGWLAFETLDHEPIFLLGGRHMNEIEYSVRPDVALRFPSAQTRGWCLKTTLTQDMLTPQSTLELRVLIAGTEVFFQSFSTVDPETDASSVPFVSFMHIPKTGGTALRQSLENSGLTVRQEYGHTLSKEAVADDSMHVLVGHFSYGTHESFARPTKYVTVVRNPFERLASHYMHAQDHHACTCQTLSQFAEAHPQGADNLITRFTAGIPWPIPLDETSAEVACANLAKDFALIGDTSNLEFFRHRLERYLGVELPALNQANVRGARKVEVFQRWDTRAQADRVRPWLEHDWRVWYFVQRLIEY